MAGAFRIGLPGAGLKLHQVVGLGDVNGSVALFLGQVFVCDAPVEGDLEFALHAARIAALLRHDERGGDAGSLCTAGAADAVDEIV